MSRGPYPTLLLLAMSLPGTVRALGLGEIRVDSSLNEPLSAQIEIVGATRDELLALTASVANREIFQRYGADRPAFLSSATFKVGLDGQGRPVLNVRSGEPFSDPLVSFLVDLRWGKNEVVREYSLLLDPAGFKSPQRGAEPHPVEAASTQAAAPSPIAQPPPVQAAHVQAAPVQAAPVPAAAAPVPTKRAARLARDRALDDTSGAVPTHHKITAHDTLRGIARHAGARGEAEVQRTMLAIFRANPNAFDGNINRLHRGVVLTLPTAAQIAAISPIDAKREVRSQMTAWRLDGRRSTPSPVVENPARALPAEESPAPATQAALSHAAESAGDSLKARVQFLEQSLQEMHEQLARHNMQLKDLAPTPLPAKALPAAAAATAVSSERVSAAASPPAPSASPGPLSGSAFLGPIAAGLALLVTGVAYASRRLKSVTLPAPPPIMSLPTESLSVSGVSEAATTNPVTAATTSAIPATASGAAATPPVTETRAASAAPAAARVDSTAPLPQSARASEPTAIAVGHRRTPLEDTTFLADIDTEALERSYLDSLGIETMASEPAKAVAGGAPPASAADSTADTVELVPGLAHSDEDTLESSTAALSGLDLEATAEHVQMPSGLNDRAVVSEGRANIVDALKMAIDRDPHRRDLRMKLLETYFSAALNNQRAFVEVVRKLSRDRDKLSADDWNKVLKMGQEIASEDLLFADVSTDQTPDALADCA
jgi:pilus assembly protein FimV